MPAVTTPFKADLSIDEDSFAANIDRLFEAGATGMVVAGCTGEFWALDHDERARLGRIAVEASAGRGPVILGTGAIREDEVIAQIENAKAAGCDGVLVLPPFFAMVTDDEIVAHFKAIDAASSLPIVLYNIPVCAVNAITPDVADRCADLENVVAIKESSGDWANFEQTLDRVQDRIRVYCGPSSVFGVKATLAGADGLIDCFPNVWTECLDLWHETKAGHLDIAGALQRRGKEMTDLFVSQGLTLYPATKAVMNHIGVPGGGHMRPPYRDLDGPNLDRLLAEFDALGARTAKIA
jgi:4-hydroxy-tetrahydrodipicolinate synthase